MNAPRRQRAHCQPGREHRHPGNAPRARGFSLIELMIAMAVGVLLTLLIGSVFSVSSRTMRITEAAEDVNGEARVALDALRHDVRLAGFLGCNSNQLLGSGGFTNTILGPADYLNAYGTYVRGYAGQGAAFSPAAPGELTGAAPAPIASADALTLRIPSGEPLALNGTMASGTADIPVFSNAGLAVGQRLIVSDCAMSSAFIVTSLPGGAIGHAAAGSNATADLGRAFGVDALVYPVSTVSYYVAAGSDSRVDAPTRSLWRRVDLDAPEEVAAHVESFRVLYGVDSDGDNFANSFVTADQVADWATVVGVRVSVLMASQTDRVNATTRTYAFDGDGAVAPADLRLRRPFTVTVGLRNRTI